ncbi:MAG: AAA family ATPase [Candidatus Micrarchaeia archaeon]
MIESIKLTNWKTHKETFIRFDKGVNVIVGVMGAGKSSVMDAISFALFGSFPALKHKKVSLTDMITKRPYKASEAKIELSFSIGQDIYDVERVIKEDGSTSAKLKKNGTYVQSQQSKVNKDIEDLLKIDYDVFSRVIYADQNNLTYFLDITKGDRKKQIDEMLGLDNFSKSESYITTIINSIRAMVEDEQKNLSSIDIEKLKEQIKNLSNEKAKTEALQEELASKKAVFYASLKKEEESFKKAREDFEKKKKIEMEISEGKKVISRLQQEIEKIGEVDKTIEELEEIEKNVAGAKATYDIEIERLQKKEKEIAYEVYESLAKIKEIEKNNETRKKLLQTLNGRNVSEMKREIEKQEQESQEKLNALSLYRSKVSEIKETINVLNNEGSTCPVCNRPLEAEMKKKLIIEKNEEISKLNMEANAISKELENAKNKIKLMKAEYESCLVAAKKLEDLKEEKSSDMIKNEVEALNAETKHIESLLKEYKNKREAYAEELNRISMKKEEVNRRNSYKKEIEETENRLKIKSEQLLSIKVNEEDIYKIQDAIRNYDSQLKAVEANIQGNEKYIKEINAQIKDKLERVNEYNIAKERINKRMNATKNMNKFKEALIDTEAALRDKLVDSVNGMMQQLWPRIYPYGDYSLIALQSDKEDYSLVGSLGSEKVVIDNVASGGERSIASLVLRIAMAMVIVPNLKWIILDEPTHNIDSNGIDKMVEILGESLPKIVEQIFIITHNEELKNITSAKVYQLEREKDKFGTTVVSEI